MNDQQEFHIGLLLFPDLTQLDLTGPYEVLTRMPGAVVHVPAKTAAPVRSGAGLSLLPTTTFADCPSLDLLCVPGGPGVADVLVDRETLDFVRRSAASARYVISVCTGALILGAAGLLDGRRRPPTGPRWRCCARSGRCPRRSASSWTAM